MIGYPFDSHVEYDEHDMPEFDRAVSSKPLKNLIAKLFSNGVLPNPSTNLQVVSGGDGMTVIVKAGFCIINGGLKLEDEDKTLVVQASDNTNPRIDTVVMRWNDNDDVRACDLYIVEGTPSASPVRPNLTRTESIYEIGLADIYITARSTSIDSFRITDTRIDTARCGYISSISEFDTSTLYAQIQSDLNNFQENEQADFLAWFEEMRDQLSEDAAGNLQLQIDNVNGRYDGLTEDINAFRVVNQLPEVGAAGTLYLVTGEEETHFAGNVDANKKIINDNVITTDSAFSSLHTSDLLNNKVDKEDGKGLSKNDFTDAHKTKLEGLPTSFKTVNGVSVVGTGDIAVQGGGGVRIDDRAPSTSMTYSSEKIEAIKGTPVAANPTLVGTEAHLDSIEIDGVKFVNAKLDADLATVDRGGVNLFDINNSKANWRPSTSSGATYSDGSTQANSYTTNLIPANKTDQSKFKINFSSQPTYFRTFFYTSEQVFKGGTNNLQQDEDGLYYIDISNSSVSGFAYICLVFSTTDATMYNNLIITDYDSFGGAKTIINDLYLSDQNVEMVKERLGFTASGNILDGKKWCVAGDSFTDGGWASGQAPLIPNGRYAGKKKVYPYIIGNRNNMTIQNIFKAGRTLAHPADDSFTNTFADNYQSIDIDADYLTIYLGINDSHHRPDAFGNDGEDTTGVIELGTIDDNTTATFYGAWNVILTWMITNRPNLKIGIIVSNACETDDYRVASIAIAKKYGIPYIDLNGDERTPCMIRSTNAEVASAVRTKRTENWRISSTNAHPNEECQVYESTIIENFLRSL